MESLAMIKMEKNFRAVIEKGYPRKPYEQYSLGELFGRLLEETEELKEALYYNKFIEAKQECADVSNIIDYIFEKLIRCNGNATTSK